MTYLTERGEVPVFALHQELGCDISGGFYFTCFLILLMELLNTFLSGDQLKGEEAMTLLQCSSITHHHLKVSHVSFSLGLQVTL